MATLQFDLVAPERNMASGAATSVIVPGVEGDLTFSAGHSPFITTLRPGFLTAEIDGQEKAFVVYGGFVEVGPDSVTVLADDAHPAEELNAEDLAKRVDIAEKRAQRTSDDVDAIARDTQILSDLRTLQMFQG